MALPKMFVAAARSLARRGPTHGASKQPTPTRVYNPALSALSPVCGTSSRHQSTCMQELFVHSSLRTDGCFIRVEEPSDIHSTFYRMYKPCPEPLAPRRIQLIYPLMPIFKHPPTTSTDSQSTFFSPSLSASSSPSPASRSAC